jgi:ring-1,2-phenylacetyl-CoA epoxidase subunit PaaA
MNRERIKSRRKAYEEGEWVREAAMEYARKKKLEEEKAS